MTKRDKIQEEMDARKIRRVPGISYVKVGDLKGRPAGWHKDGVWLAPGYDVAGALAAVEKMSKSVE